MRVYKLEEPLTPSGNLHKWVCEKCSPVKISLKEYATRAMAASALNDHINGRHP